MNYKENKGIADLIKCLRELNQQIEKTDSNIRKVLSDIQKAIPIDSFSYELASDLFGDCIIQISGRYYSIVKRFA